MILEVLKWRSSYHSFHYFCTHDKRSFCDRLKIVKTVAADFKGLRNDSPLQLLQPTVTELACEKGHVKGLSMVVSKRWFELTEGLSCTV